jgi:iron complex outermembrane receptor protein
MFNKLILVFFNSVLIINSGLSQDCDITITGYVYDEGTKSPLSFVNIFLQETQQGTSTDEGGFFTLENICVGHYHFIFSHIGCEDVKQHFDIYRDTTLNILLAHNSEVLGTVVVDGKRDQYSNQAKTSLNRQKIEENSYQSISTILENETGVSLLKNGNGISKPIVHGLFGNRLTMLNNGIQQSGQQWGNDHSPEIDPFSMDKITILKGASAIEYGGNNLGGVILAEPQRIEKEPHLHGQLNYIHETNGRGNTYNARLGKYGSRLAWKFNGTYKSYGDKNTPNYFLNNTGLEEFNLSLQLEKSWDDKVFFDFYASTFNTTLGVLRGSHISNLTDLEDALTRDEPFFTEPDFSTFIEAPKQEVSHHLAKAKGKIFIKEDQILELTVAGQINDRDEFDIRRGDRSEIPALSLSQFTLNTEIKYTQTLENEWKLKAGQQNIFTHNNNNPDTGTLPLIPDYISWKSGIYSTLSKQLENIYISTGIRYDYEFQNVATITRTFPRRVERFKNNFHNVSGLLGLKKMLGSKQSLSWNIGFAMRNPAVNELYSNGLHQGVSGIEEGRPDLETEKAIKNTLEYQWLPTSDFTITALAYHQRFEDYIFLEPQNDFRITVRGAFPLFIYEQTNASISGLDLSTQYTFSHKLVGLFKFSYLRGRDQSNDIPLVFMPPISLFTSLTYRVQKSMALTKSLKMEDSEIEISNRLVFEQKHILDDQDFSPPPPTYSVLDLKFSTNFILPRYKIRCFVRADNLLNTTYRDYLNRQRYFSDDVGRSIVLGLNVKF